MPRKRRLEHGVVQSGRLQLAGDSRDVVRAYTRMKWLHARAAAAKARAAHGRMNTDQSREQLRYWEHVEGFLAGLYHQGQHSVPPLDWEDAWLHTTTVERHAGVAASGTPTIPGME